MGAWYICRRDERSERRLAEARLQFRDHGHHVTQSFETPYFAGIAAPHVYAGAATFFRRGDDFVVIAGTLSYRGEIGEEALRLLLEDYEPPFARWDDVVGQFAALIFKRGRLFLFTDWAAFFHVYQSDDRSVFSTSFLSTVRSLPSLRFNPQAVYEFVFHGTPLGNDSVFAEISRPDRTEELELGKTVVTHASARTLPIAEAAEPLEDKIDRSLEKLRTIFSVAARHFGANVQCPLSGGFDSRLVFALLLDRGVRPSLYVYGTDQDDDVQIARLVAAGEGFDIDVFDKGAFHRNASPEEFREIVARNFNEMDATPMGGGLFDTGGNSKARHDRARGGALAVSGAAGEIFRNYFYLRDRPFRTRAVVDAFYAGFDARQCTPRFDQNEFLRRVDQKIRAALAVDDRPLSRLEIESTYPLFRCPAFFGREISMVGRFGPYFVPFCEQSIVRETANIPVKWRTHGMFQSKLLTRVNRRLAGYPSAYGHSFDAPPSFRHRLSVATSLYRPTWLRRHGYRMKQALALRPSGPARLSAHSHFGAVLDASFPMMRSFFDVDRMTDPQQFRSVATLEYLAQSLGDRIKM